MRKLFLPSLLAICLLFSGCFQARVTTDKTPGKTVEKKWATGFINGLAMTNSNINAAQECPNGVASVETQLSFLNQIVSGLTFGIYSPMTVKVTCAAGSSTSSLMKAPSIEYEVPQDAATGEVRETVMAAASKSAQSENPVYVQFSSE
jgi:hypothetical protein